MGRLGFDEGEIETKLVDYRGTRKLVFFNAPFSFTRAVQ
jgi:hypothetical protein